MDAPLNLFDQLLSQARRLQQLGRHREATALFTRLAGFRALPADVAEETQVRLAQLQLKRRRFTQARRHLTAALRHQPDNARYHYLLGFTWQAGEEELEKAAEHYRRALELDPTYARCHTAYGLLALRLGRVEEGVEHLRQALEQAPDNFELLAKAIKGLCQAGRIDDAHAILKTARFRHGRTPAFRQLWDDFQFQQLRRRRETARLSQPRPDGEPVLLPFVRVERERTEPATPAILRHDAAAPVPAPHRPRLLRRPRVQ
jgi:Tfp pilus assembly protein PilF